MEAVKILLEGIYDLNISQEFGSNMVTFVLENPSYHQSIIEQGYTLHVMHDISGLMRDDEHFVPRVLFKTNTRIEELKEKLTRYYEVDLDNCNMTNEMWIEQLAECMVDSDEYIKDFNNNLKDYEDERRD